MEPDSSPPGPRTCPEPLRRRCSWRQVGSPPDGQQDSPGYEIWALCPPCLGRCRPLPAGEIPAPGGQGRTPPASPRPHSRRAQRWRGRGSARARRSRVIRSCRISAGAGSGAAAPRCRARGDEVGDVNLLICLRANSKGDRFKSAVTRLARGWQTIPAVLVTNLAAFL